MKLDAQEIVTLVGETEKKRGDWARAADIWENDWKLSRYADTRENKQELDGVDIVVTPDPFNVIQLLQRFVAHEMRVEVPYLTEKDDDAGRSNTISEWLVTFDILSNRQQGVNHVNDMTWQSGVLGRGAAQILWIGDVIPRGVSTSNTLPIWRRTLDPRNVGISRGPYWTDYAYHKYEASRADIMQRYPKYKLPDQPNGKVIQGLLNERYTVIDMWTLHEGAIWHSVVVNGGTNGGSRGEFALGPVKTDYPDVPIIEWFADGAPLYDELWRSLSILHPIHESWKQKCDVMSKVATGLMYHYDPLMVAKGQFTDAEKDALREAGPGSIAFLKPDQDLSPFSPAPNVPMAQAFLAMLQQGIDQATFPGVTYGDAPGGVNAGFAINNLAQQAQARATVIRQNIESAAEREFQMTLQQIEAFVPDEGVTLYKRTMAGQRGKPLTLNKKTIKGNYDVEVRLIPERPMDDTQKILAWSGLAEKGFISEAFFRDEGLNVQMPRNEETRIAVERALKSPEMQLKVQLRALQDTYDQDDWELMIQGTPLQQVWETERQWLEQKKAQREAEKQQRAQEREQKRLAELLAQGKAHRMPDGTIMEGQMPMMPPGPPMDGSMPPLPPGGPMMPGGMPPSPPPPGGMQPQGLPGMPPQAAGQFSPDALGIPPGAPPGMFDQLMGGQGPSEEDMLAQLMGGGMPPQM